MLSAEIFVFTVVVLPQHITFASKFSMTRTFTDCYSVNSTTFDNIIEKTHSGVFTMVKANLIFFTYKELPPFCMQI